MRDNAADQGNASPDESPAIAVGRRLGAAREAAGLSVADVAAKTNLGETVIVALESGDFDTVGAPVFVRGHLRSYARLLKLPEAEITAACADTPAALRSQTARQEFRPGFSIVNAALLAALALLVLIAVVYWASGGGADDEIDIPSEPAVTGALGAPLGALGTGQRFDSSDTVPSQGLSGNNTARFIVSSDTLA